MNTVAAETSYTSYRSRLTLELAQVDQTMVSDDPEKDNNVDL